MDGAGVSLLQSYSGLPVCFVAELWAADKGGQEWYWRGRR